MNSISSASNKITDIIIPFKTPLKTPTTITNSDYYDSCSIPISMEKGEAEIYSDGNNTITVPIWGYNGEYPGPLIEIRDRNDVATIQWINTISEEDPLENVVQADSVNYTDGSNPNDERTIPTPQNVLDNGQFDTLKKDTMGAKGKAFLSIHLHGGKTTPSSDGWPESMLAPKTETDGEQSLLCRYENKQRAMMLWYHDHAMHTTRLNNYAGLAGLWIIRDSEENSLPLPRGEDLELPLVIQDRNLTGFNGFEDTANTKLLHRVEHGDGPLEFFGPLTLVNGCIWPIKEVEATAYRLRILNGSNSRFYRLRFAERNENEQGDVSYQWIDSNDVVKQIGTDCGLLDRPINLPTDNSLTLSPAERADLIVDFSKWPEKNIVLLNTAEAPFSGSDPISTNADGLFVDKPDSQLIGGDAWRTPYPEVMLFAVGSKPKNSYNYDFAALEGAMTNLTSYIDEDPTGNDQKTRTVVLVEKTENRNTDQEKIVLVEWELEEFDKLKISTKVPTILEGKRTIEIIENGNRNQYIVTAERFQDPINWMVKLNSTEKWRFINLTADTHPMHVHLVQFKAISRKKAEITETNKICTFPDGSPVKQDANNIRDIVEAVDCLSLANTPIKIDIGTTPKKMDENEKGFKDTIRVNPGEMIEIVAKFEGHCGRYVYHCHLLEHEDHDMMRQFIVTRDDMDDIHMTPISVGRPQS